MQDIIVVGGGPAGLTAALYAARAGCSVLVLEQALPGGQIIFSPAVENYPGMPGMSGADFSQRLSDQVTALGVTLDYGTVTGFRAGDEGCQVGCEGGKSFSCKALVLAPGARHRTLGLPGEEALVGQGVSYCAVCDGPFFAGKHTAVVGGGDTALQDALFLSGVCAQVTLIHRRDQFRGAARLADQVRQRDNVQLMLGWRPEAYLLGDKGFRGLELACVTTGERRELLVDGVFVAVGQEPGTGAFSGQIPVDAGGYFLAGEDCKTPLPGVFVAGDCRAKAVRQLATAVSDGAVAGLAAVHFLEG